MRLFVAIDLPSRLKTVLGGLQREIKQQNFLEGNFVRSESLHITIKFLGEVPEESITELKKALAMVALKSERFQLELSGLGAFPTSSTPRVLFVSVKNGGSATRLHEAVDAALESLGFAPDSKYENHVTLARVSAVIKKEKLAGIFEKFAGRSLGVFDVSRIVLMESTLTSKGPAYKILGNFQLH